MQICAQKKPLWIIGSHTSFDWNHTNYLLWIIVLSLLRVSKGSILSNCVKGFLCPYLSEMICPKRWRQWGEDYKDLFLSSKFSRKRNDWEENPDCKGRCRKNWRRKILCHRVSNQGPKVPQASSALLLHYIRLIKGCTCKNHCFLVCFICHYQNNKKYIYYKVFDVISRFIVFI